MIKQLESVILLQVDCEKGEGIDLKKEFNISGYPTFVLTNQMGETIHRWWGYSKDLLFKELSAGLSDPTTITEKMERYEKNPDAGTAQALAIYHFTSRKYKEAMGYYQEAAQMNSEQDFAYEQYDVASSGYRRDLFSLAEFKTAANKALESTNIGNSQKARIYVNMIGVLRDKPADRDLLEEYTKEGYQFVTNEQTKIDTYWVKRLAIANALYLEQDMTKAVRLKKESMQQGWLDNANDLNSFSWWCFENKLNLQEAMELAKRAIKLSEPGAERAMILDTAAEIANELGSAEEAAALMEVAVKEDPTNEYWQKQLKRFKNDMKD